MRFLVDMAHSPRTVEFLKNNDYDAVRVNEVFEGRGIEDKGIFEYAIEYNL